MEPITKIKSQVGIFLLKFTKFPDEPVRRNFSRKNPNSDLIYIYIYIYFKKNKNQFLFFLKELLLCDVSYFELFTRKI